MPGIEAPGEPKKATVTQVFRPISLCGAASSWSIPVLWRRIGTVLITGSQIVGGDGIFAVLPGIDEFPIHIEFGAQWAVVVLP